jgi:hypothetical protein
MLDEKLVPVEALRELNIPGQKTKRKGAKLELPEATVKILEVGENPSVKRVEVEKVVSTTVNKTTILGESK